MKRKIITALLVGTMTLSLPVSCLAEVAEETVEAAAETEEEAPAEEDFRAIGEETDKSITFWFQNNTGKKITSVFVRKADTVEYCDDLLDVKKGEAEENADAAEEQKPEVIEDKELIKLFFNEPEEEKAEEAADAAEEKKDETEEAVCYDLKLIFEDQTEAELHKVDVENLEHGFKIELKENICYITGKDTKEKKDVDTYEAEKAIYDAAAAAKAEAEKAAAEAAAAQAAAAQAEEYSYDEYDDDDYSYDDSDDYSYDDSDDYGYDEPDVDDSGDGGDGCLDDGLMF